MTKLFTAYLTFWGLSLACFGLLVVVGAPEIAKVVEEKRNYKGYLH